MADPKDTAGAATPQSPAGKSGAVKPPVLEGTARPAESVKPTPAPKPGPAPKPEPTKSAEPTKPESKPITPPPVSSAESGAGTAWLAGLVGGVVGLGAAYGLALLGYWPAVAPAPQPADPRIATISTAVPELETVTSTLQDELARLTARVAGLETNPGAAAPTGDSTPSAQVAGDLAALSARVDELTSAPQAANETTAQNAAAIAALETEIAALRQASAQAQTDLDGVSAKIATLETDVSEGAAVEAGQVRLPLIVSGFETAFATGAAYDAEVAALRQALPSLAVPEAVLANAMTGLKRPDLIARDFNAVLPDILAGRPVGADAGWQEATSDWFRGIIALRPTEAVEGDGPEAIVARLEGAIGRGDFIAAKTELDALPPSMRTATGVVAGEIANQAAAQSFLASLRQAALTGGSGA
ncbi:COG4223 family protein [Devosia riboflavina]